MKPMRRCVSGFDTGVEKDEGALLPRFSPLRDAEFRNSIACSHNFFRLFYRTFLSNKRENAYVMLLSGYAR
jgi:hypothetical protein